MLTPSEIKLIEANGITENVHAFSVSDSELWYLYNNAQALLVPSMYEGFSLPLVEALHADIPVICSDIQVHREVAKGFAEFLNPLICAQWVDSILSLDSFRRPSQMLGETAYKELLAYYSRKRLVNQHVSCYRKLL